MRWRFKKWKKNWFLTKEWDKTFPKSGKVNHRKVTFHNRYGITLAADLYEPKNAAGKLAAIAVCGPFGAVKEQAAGPQCPENQGLQKRLLRLGLRRGGGCAGGRTLLCEGLPRLLQDKTRLSRPFPKFQRRLECDRLHVLHESADFKIQQRNPQRRAYHPRGKGAFLLFQPRRLCRYGAGQSLCGQ